MTAAKPKAVPEVPVEVRVGPDAEAPVIETVVNETPAIEQVDPGEPGPDAEPGPVPVSPSVAVPAAEPGADDLTARVAALDPGAVPLLPQALLAPAEATIRTGRTLDWGGDTEVLVTCEALLGPTSGEPHAVRGDIAKIDAALADKLVAYRSVALL